MVYKLYNRTGSGGFAVEAALAVAGQPFELIAVESQPSTPLPESFKAINPWGQVPVLLLPDGTMMTETGAILIYLATRHPGDGIAPPLDTSEAAEVMRWCVFLSVNVYEATIRRVYPDRYTTDADGAAGVKAAAIARNDDAFALIEASLTDEGFLVGRQQTVADIYLAMLYAWHPGQRFERLVALTHRVAADRVIAPLWRRNFDHRLKIKWGRER